MKFGLGFNFFDIVIGYKHRIWRLPLTCSSPGTTRLGQSSSMYVLRPFSPETHVLALTILFCSSPISYRPNRSPRKVEAIPYRR